MTNDINVVIEIPKGSRNKYEFDPVNNCFKLDRMLFSSVHYPCDYGFIPDTLAGDGDPLDVLVIVGEATFPGCRIQSRPVGVFEMTDEKGADEKILSVPISDPTLNHINTLADVPKHLLKEIVHFFTIYKDLEGKKTTVKGWKDEIEAWAVIKQTQDNFLRAAKSA